MAQNRLSGTASWDKIARGTPDDLSDEQKQVGTRLAHAVWASGVAHSWGYLQQHYLDNCLSRCCRWRETGIICKRKVTGISTIVYIALRAGAARIPCRRAKRRPGLHALPMRAAGVLWVRHLPLLLRNTGQDSHITSADLISCTVYDLGLNAAVVCSGRASLTWRPRSSWLPTRRNGGGTTLVVLYLLQG